MTPQERVQSRTTALAFPGAILEFESTTYAGQAHATDGGLGQAVKWLSFVRHGRRAIRFSAGRLDPSRKRPRMWSPTDVLEFTGFTAGIVPINSLRPCDGVDQTHSLAAAIPGQPGSVTRYLQAATA